ncbi:hypothetical protein KY290_026467 [Solanum tuberosum]|uniref:Uncharacterized protein n=1 Tax=Solanum tuberosum TaxID=4113 RepID=A0ABQ7UWJ0_SOLTU|nr:hypothetical protein KY290_026467 [Solanum tuberosum]
MQKKNEDLQNEEAKVEPKLKMYLEKLTHLENTVSLQQKGAAKNSAVNVSLIQKMLADLEAKDDDIVQVNSKGSAADGDLQEKQLSPLTPPLVNSAANGNGCAAGSGNTDFISTKKNLVNYPEVQTLHPIPSTGGSAHINSNVSNIQKKRLQSQQAAAGSGNTKFISTKMNLLNYPDVQTLHPIPSAGGSAHVNSNVSNIQKKRRQSQQADTTIWLTIFPTNMECQIKAVMYTDEIEQYAATLKLLNTYLISTAKVKVSPTSYGKPIHKFHWILDKETVIEQIKASHEVEKPLPPPTKLNITSFDRIPHLMVDSAAEIDILEIVLRCGPQKNAGRSHHRCREITLCDNQRNQFLFTLWEDFGEIEGHEISSKMATEADLLVILGRSIGISTYQASISAELGEKLLSMTAEDIFDITCTKRQSLSLTHVHEMLSNKVFEIQLRKSSWGSSNTTNATLSILSYMEKKHTPERTTDRTPKKIKPLETSEVEVMATTATVGPSNAPAKFEPPTPTKKV